MNTAAQKPDPAVELRMVQAGPLHADRRLPADRDAPIACGDKIETAVDGHPKRQPVGVIRLQDPNAPPGTILKRDELDAGHLRQIAGLRPNLGQRHIPAK